MEYSIHNDYLNIKIKDKGAELFSVVHRHHNLEYMWSGDPAFWGKTSPVLFPIVGALKGNSYLFNNQKYLMSRHGFARDATFQVENHVQDCIVFLLTSNDSSLLNYPFHFELRIIYTLVSDTLHVTYEVANTGDDAMYFSIGAHPAFKVPLVSGSAYHDHYLEFSKTENSPRWPISSEGLIKKDPEPLLQRTSKLALDKKLFEDDALVLKDLQSKTVSLKSSVHHHGLEFSFEGFPFLGIWAAKNADFVCIEPWCGIADSVDHNQQLVMKEGIENIESGRIWSRTWRAQFF